MSKTIIVLREDEKPESEWKEVTLAGNEQLPKQVDRNRLWRKVYARLNAVNLHGNAIVPDTLLVNILYPGETPVQYTVDSQALIIRRFDADAQWQKRAIHEAAALTIFVANNPKDKDNLLRQARANELQWLAVTGNIIKEVKAKKMAYVSTGKATEPTIGEGTLASFKDL